MVEGPDNRAVQEGRKDMAAPEISIIAPTRNEAGNIAPLLERIAGAVGNLPVEVLIVDDSTDETPQTVRAMADAWPFPVRLIARPVEQRNGLSGAVVDGMRAAEGTWACVMDADLQHPPQMITAMWELAQKTGADMVVGSRRGNIFGPLGLTRWRSLTSKSLTILARLLFPRLLKNVSDPLTGLFLVRRGAVDFASLRPEGFKILLEILVRCPALHVTELYFDFAPRCAGESKADFREGMRFFRHLVRLRFTANVHLLRFLASATVGLLGNTLLLWLLVELLAWPVMAATVVAAEALILWFYGASEWWIFPERERTGRRRRFWSQLLLGQVFLFAVQLPLITLWLAAGLPGYLAANFVALLVVGLARYGVSEQWIWTRQSMAWQHRSYRYDIHGILTVASQVPLAELSHFQVAVSDDAVDIQIRVDRQGTPSLLPGGISYDEHLGRFGFGLTVLPGSYTQVIVSPLLLRSPHFLFTNIVEPVLRWAFVREGYALVKAAAVASGSGATLVHANGELGQLLVEFCRRQSCAYMADDFTLVDRQGRAYCYPKPITVREEIIAPERPRPAFGRRMALRARGLLYTRFLRAIGLWLSKLGLPAATLNTYLQWWVPQPKRLVSEVARGLDVQDMANIVQILRVVEPAGEQGPELPPQALVEVLQQQVEAASFQPHSLLAQKLRFWEEDLLAKERDIISLALAQATYKAVDEKEGAWTRHLLPQPDFPAREGARWPAGSGNNATVRGLGNAGSGLGRP